jgi:DNA-binding transcriptional ArsR family regulator
MPNRSPSLDQVFQALADPTRRAVIERLSRGPASVSALAEPLDMKLPSLLQHLQVLEESGLVRSEKIGRVRTCRLEPGAFDPLERWVAARKSAWARNFDRLAAYLDDAKKRDH